MKAKSRADLEIRTKTPFDESAAKGAKRRRFKNEWRPEFGAY
jgi:hypothetical protein